MKNTLRILALLFITALAFTSCRDEKTAEEKAQDMIENANETKVKEDKVKIENEDGSETKIKYDENGDVEKIKTDDNS
jgi:uncharacterized protein YxeA